MSNQYKTEALGRDSMPPLETLHVELVGDTRSRRWGHSEVILLPFFSSSRVTHPTGRLLGSDPAGLGVPMSLRTSVLVQTSTASV